MRHPARIVLQSSLLILLLASSVTAGEPPLADAPPADLCFLPAQDCSAAYRVWASTEYLLWWVKGSPVPVPVATVGPASAVAPGGGVGALGAPGTTVLLGNQNLSFGPASGARFTLGTWLNREGTVGLEGGYFFLSQRTSTRVVGAPGTPGSPSLGIPFFNAETGAEDATGLATPASSFAGTVALTAATRLQGFEANGVLAGARRENWQLYWLGGFRYLDLTESLTFDTSSPNVPPAPADVFATWDQFRTVNNFYGGQLGARALYRGGRWFAAATGKVALGDMQQQTRISGVLASNDFNGFGAVQTFPGGYFALPTNSGTYTRDRFAVVPEANLSVGYQVNRFVSLFAGYSFLYLSNVARPGDQIDRVISPSQATSFTNAPAATLAGPARPTFLGNTSDFWAHGINLGMAFTY